MNMQTPMKRSFAAILAGAGIWLGLVPGPGRRSGPPAALHGRRLEVKLGDFAGADKAGFDDSAWRSLEVPHDWGVEGSFDALNPAGGAGAFLPAGTGWYRRHFGLPSDLAGRRVFVEFEGVMANSDVWINDAHLGRRPFGYVSFRYEITAHVRLGDKDPNVLAVRVNNADQPASRWYTGSGIYRHVRLIVVNPVHFDRAASLCPRPWRPQTRRSSGFKTPWSTSRTRSPRPRCRLNYSTTRARAWGPPKARPRRSPPGKRPPFSRKSPSQTQSSGAWTIRRCTRGLHVRAAGTTLDDCRTPFGIRDAHFEAATGFCLNGRNIKLKGVCLHADGSAFGAAVPLDIWERRLRILRGLGANSIRTAHNPPDPEFLDLCDRMGFLVMDEMFDCWTVAKNIADYHLYFEDWSKTDARDTVRRDRNHPSIILYSAGNEIHDTPNAELSKRILAGLVAVFHENDSTRPVTKALLRPNATHDYDDGLADLLDVIGTNYRDTELLAAHAARPSRIIVGTENHHDRAAWLAVRDNAPYSGQFLWAGIDYLGEAPLWPLVPPTPGSSTGRGAAPPGARKAELVGRRARRPHRPPRSPCDLAWDRWRRTRRGGQLPAAAARGFRRLDAV